MFNGNAYHKFIVKRKTYCSWCMGWCIFQYEHFFHWRSHPKIIMNRLNIQRKEYTEQWTSMIDRVVWNLQFKIETNLFSLDRNFGTTEVWFCLLPFVNTPKNSQIWMNPLFIDDCFSWNEIRMKMFVRSLTSYTFFIAAAHYARQLWTHLSEFMTV